MKDQIIPPGVETRRLVKSGASVIVSIPPEWLNENGLHAGDSVMFISNGDLVFKKITQDNVDKIKEKLNLNDLSGPVATLQAEPVGKIPKEKSAIEKDNDI